MHTPERYVGFEKVGKQAKIVGPRGVAAAPGSQAGRQASRQAGRQHAPSGKMLPALSVQLRHVGVVSQVVEYRWTSSM